MWSAQPGAAGEPGAVQEDARIVDKAGDASRRLVLP